MQAPKPHLPSQAALFATAGVLALAVLAQFLPDSLKLLLRYQHDAISDGELWRLISGHLLHLSWPHLGLNACALILMALLFESQWRTRDLVLGGLCCTLGISLALYFLEPQITWYVGLSGVLHGLFVIAGLRLFERQRGFATLLLLGLIAKLIWEYSFGSASESSWLGGAVVHQAHRWGALAGLLYAALPRATGSLLAKHA